MASINGRPVARPSSLYAMDGKDRRIGCRDLAGRRRQLIVFPVGGRLVLIVPAGATAALNWRQVGRLRVALRAGVGR